MNHLKLKDVQHACKNMKERLHRTSAAIWLNSRLFERSVQYILHRTPPEDGHSRWPKHVAGYAVYTTVNPHTVPHAPVRYFPLEIISAVVMW